MTRMKRRAPKPRRRSSRLRPSRSKPMLALTEQAVDRMVALLSVVLVDAEARLVALEQSRDCDASTPAIRRSARGTRHTLRTTHRMASQFIEMFGFLVPRAPRRRSA